MNRRIFFVLYLTVFATILGLGIIGPVMPIYASSLGANGIWLGVIFASFSISRAIFMPIIGKLSDERGRKRFILFGLIAYFAVSFLYPLAGGVLSLSAVRFIHGLVSAVVIPIAMAYVGEMAEPGTEGRTMGTFNQAMFLGMATGPLLGGFLYDFSGFSSVFLPLSVLTALAFFLVLFFLPEKKGIAMPRGSVSFKEILSNRIITGLLIFRMVNALGRGGVLSFIPLLAHQLGFSTLLIGVMVSVPILLTAMLQRPFGALSDKYANKLVFVLAGAVTGASSLFLVPSANSFFTLILVLCLMGLGGAMAMPAAAGLVVTSGKGLGLGATMGLFNTSMSIGMVAGPLIAGLVMQTLGLKAIFCVAGAISFAGIFVFVLYVGRESFTAGLKP